MSVILVSDLSLTCNVTESALFHLSYGGWVRPYTSLHSCKKLAHAFLSSHTDCCNSLFTAVSVIGMQHVQDVAARVPTGTNPDDITSAPSLF